MQWGKSDHFERISSVAICLNPLSFCLERQFALLNTWMYSRVLLGSVLLVILVLYVVLPFCLSLSSVLCLLRLTASYYHFCIFKLFFLPVSLDCSFWIAPPVFSNVSRLFLWYQTIPNKINISTDSTSAKHYPINYNCLWICQAVLCMSMCRALEIFQIMKNIFIQAIDFRKPMKSCGFFFFFSFFFWKTA